MYEFDDTTNLPVVPEGYFWSVYLYWGSYDNFPSVRVMLRKRRKFGSKVIASTDGVLAYREDKVKPLIRLSPDEYAKGIQEFAETVLSKNEKQLQDAAYYDSFRAAQKKLSGDYPPKRLED